MKPMRARLGLERGGGADEERALVLGEDEARTRSAAPSTVASTMPKLVSGHSAATAASGSANRNPTASTGL